MGEKGEKKANFEKIKQDSKISSSASLLYLSSSFQKVKPLLKSYGYTLDCLDELSWNSKINWSVEMFLVMQLLELLIQIALTD